VCQFCINLTGRPTEDHAQPGTEANDCLPFTGLRCPLAQMRLVAATVTGKTADFMSREEMAYALSQVNAQRTLLPLTNLACGSDLLRYQVTLADCLDYSLLAELRMVLHEQGHELHWEQIGHQSYLCVIGAGVAACLEMTPGAEMLTLRYASSLENELFHAGQTLDLPRSRLFLQAALYERFDLLLAQVRQRTWHWLYADSE
jgi:hypothetical protein